MMHIKCRLDKSDSHGIGLFTEENLKEGQVIYTVSPLLDLDLTQEEFDSLQDNEKEEIKYWGYFDEYTKKWHVDFDIIRFTNHSEDGTITQDPEHKEVYLVASRDLKSGEEITQNYLEFETEEDLKSRGII